MMIILKMCKHYGCIPRFSVARNILRLKEHKVDLEKVCTITLEAKPVQLMVPSYVEVQQNYTIQKP